MRLKKLLLLTLSTAIIMSSTSCNQTEQDIKKATIDNTNQLSEDTNKKETEAVPSEEELKRLKTEKYNTYIKTNNFMTDRLQTVINSYFKRVKSQEKFEMNGTDFWCNSLGDSYYEILNVSNEYVEKEPSFEKLDKTYKKLYPVLTKMMKAFDEVYNYGELKTYLDDDYAGAEKLHADVWKQYKKYKKLSNTFFNEMTKLSDTQRKETMKELKEKGYEVRYSLIETISIGQEIQQFFVDNKIDDSNLIETDLKKLEPLYKKFTKTATTAYNNLRDTKKVEKERLGTVGTVIESSLTDTKVSMTELYKRIKDKTPVDSFELNTSFPAKNTIAGFNSKLGDLIRSYNNLHTY